MAFIHKPRRKVVLLAVGATALVIVGMAVGFVVLLSGAYSTSATTQHFLLTHRLLDIGLHYSVREASSELAVPPLDRPGMVELGTACYASNCVQCHGAPGVASAAEGKGMLPIPNNLAQTARERSPAWLYYVTSKGIRMTGMPAWEYRLSEHSLWSTVAFLERLPFLTNDDYDALRAAANSFDCKSVSQPPARNSPEDPKVVLRQYACHSCHRIEGVVGPRTYVGPALVDWARRKYIAGVLPNTHENLVRFIREPQLVSPGTLMPDQQVGAAHAELMATYLMELK